MKQIPQKIPFKPKIENRNPKPKIETLNQNLKP